MIEQVILVDETDQKVGVCEKLEAHIEGLLHRAFSVFLFDGEGRFLVQRRALDKYHSGGRWANTACGHPRPGEELGAAAKRRLFEEMGIACDLEHHFARTYFIDFGTGLKEHEFVHFFCGFYEGGVKPNPAEVCQWEWRTEEELRAGSDYAGWFALYLEENWDRLAAMRAETLSASSV